MSAPIVVERRIAASPAVVYRYQSDSWARWQGIGATVDATPGGIFTIDMANGMKSRGQFLELIPERRVVFTWGWIDHPGVPPGSSTVEIDLDDEGEATLLTLTHRDLPPDEVPTHTMGWDHYVPRLAIVSEGGDPGADEGLA